MAIRLFVKRFILPKSTYFVTYNIFKLLQLLSMNIFPALIILIFHISPIFLRFQILLIGYED